MLKIDLHNITIYSTRVHTFHVISLLSLPHFPLPLSKGARRAAVFCLGGIRKAPKVETTGSRMKSRTLSTALTSATYIGQPVAIYESTDCCLVTQLLGGLTSPILPRSAVAQSAPECERLHHAERLSEVF